MVDHPDAIDSSLFASVSSHALDSSSREKDRASELT